MGFAVHWALGARAGRQGTAWAGAARLSGQWASALFRSRSATQVVALEQQWRELEGRATPPSLASPASGTMAIREVPRDAEAWQAGAVGARGVATSDARGTRVAQPLLSEAEAAEVQLEMDSQGEGQGLPAAGGQLPMQ
jgi:hypothetical protein